MIWAVVEEDYRSAGRSKQFDHALPGLSDSNPLHWNEERKKKKKTKCEWQVWQREEQFGCSLSINVKWLFTDLALAGSPRWTECIFGPVTAAPRSSEPPQCCSTSRATSRSPPSPASKRPCSLQQKRINNTEWKMKYFCPECKSNHRKAKPEWRNKSGSGKEPPQTSGQLRDEMKDDKCFREISVNMQAENSCSIMRQKRRCFIILSFISLTIQLAPFGATSREIQKIKDTSNLLENRFLKTPSCSISC